MTNVVMPQMGESIAEGTIVRWIRKIGDQVDRDEPLFEISTDKVDAEIPSPAAGTLAATHVKEGETGPGGPRGGGARRGGGGGAGRRAGRGDRAGRRSGRGRAAGGRRAREDRGGHAT